jgi:hypothetical protein
VSGLGNGKLVSTEGLSESRQRPSGSTTYEDRHEPSGVVNLSQILGNLPVDWQGIEPPTRHEVRIPDARERV